MYGVDLIFDPKLRLARSFVIRCELGHRLDYVFTSRLELSRKHRTQCA